MKRHLLHWTIGATLLAGMFAAPARAEVKVSVTLTGSLDEIQAILSHLKTLGSIGGQYGDSLKMNLHSVMDSEEVEAGATPMQNEAAAEPEPEKPELAIVAPAVTPASVKPGDEVLITVTIHDTNKVVDTVAVKDTAPGGSTFDLYDNGSSGDAEAGDGVWSRKVKVAEALNPGERQLVVTAFDVNGEPVVAPGAEAAEGGEAPQLSTEVAYTVAP